MSDSSTRVVSVEIQGQRYAIRSSLDDGYVAELAAYVDGKIQAATEATPSGDSLKVTVLAALNIADEYFRSRYGEQNHSDQILRRAEAIEQMLDSVLARVRR